MELREHAIELALQCLLPIKQMSALIRYLYYENLLAYMSWTAVENEAANGRAKALGQQDGLVKILADSKTDEILGAHMIGPYVSELVQEIVVAMSYRASSEDIARIIHGHPTLSETVHEAALAVDCRPTESGHLASGPGNPKASLLDTGRRVLVT